MIEEKAVVTCEPGKCMSNNINEHSLTITADGPRFKKNIDRLCLLVVSSSITHIPSSVSATCVIFLIAK
jgi:hypothetical protein